MISEELISEVLRLYPQYSNSDFCSGNIQIKQHSIHFEVNKSYMTQLNMYEFAHKCKEWAYKNGYNIESDYIGYTRISTTNDSYIVKSDTLGLCQYSEQESIFMDCQWILDNKDNK